MANPSSVPYEIINSPELDRLLECNDVNKTISWRIDDFCEDFVTEKKWTKALLVFGILSVVAQVVILFWYRENIQKQDEKKLSFTDNVIENRCCECCGPCWSTWSHPIRWIPMCLNHSLVDDCIENSCYGWTFALNEIISFGNLVDYFQQFMTYFYIFYVTRYMLVELQGCNEDTLDGLNQLKRLTKGGWFYAGSLFSLSLDILITLLINRSRKARHQIYSFAYVAMGPLPIMNILEYLYIDRLLLGASFAENEWAIFNNSCTIIFIFTGMFKDSLDQLIYSIRDKVCSPAELAYFFASLSMGISTLARLFVNLNWGFWEIKTSVLGELDWEADPEKCINFQFFNQSHQFQWQDWLIIATSSFCILLGFLIVISRFSAMLCLERKFLFRQDEGLNLCSCCDGVVESIVEYGMPNYKGTQDYTYVDRYGD